MASTTDPAQTFWEFSLRLYARPGIKELLLHMQEAHEADVNLLLYCCYAAVRGAGELSVAELREAAHAIGAWRQEVTVPLRRVRNHLKANPALNALPGMPKVREKVLEAELESERVTQRLLVSGLKNDLPPPSKEQIELAATASLRAYLELLDCAPQAAVLEALQPLLEALGSPEPD